MCKMVVLTHVLLFTFNLFTAETRPDETEEMREFERDIFQQLGEVGETTEKEMLDASVGQQHQLLEL